MALLVLILENSVWDKLLPTIIASSILILIFILGRLLDLLIDRQKDKKNWYLTIIIQPNISKLYSFYKKVLTSTKSSINRLQKVVTDDEQRLVEVASDISKFQKLKREFEFEFISLVNSNYPETAEGLTNILQELEDYCTTYIDSFESPQEIIFERTIEESKSKLIQELFKPLDGKTWMFWFNKKFWLLTFIFFLVLVGTLLNGDDGPKKENESKQNSYQINDSSNIIENDDKKDSISPQISVDTPLIKMKLIQEDVSKRNDTLKKVNTQN